MECMAQSKLPQVAALKSCLSLSQINRQATRLETVVLPLLKAWCSLGYK